MPINKNKGIYIDFHITAKVKKHQNLNHEAHWLSLMFPKAKAFIKFSGGIRGSINRQVFPSLEKSVSNGAHFIQIKQFLFQ